MRTDAEHTIYLKDYAPSPYRIVSVDLDFRILAENTTVTTQLTIEPRDDTAPGTPLVLDGDELSLTSIAIDGAPLVLSAYLAEPNSLTVFEPPLRRFVLETEVVLQPENNTPLMGLYRSSGTWCTQCEPEGFRRITYYMDRPDILATFNVRMTAPRDLAPVLLANGNLVDRGDAGDGMHFAVWQDPFPKPSYLFALVAGDLGAITDTFTTASGRKVDLAIYCTHGKEDQCYWAMDSLKRSMAWDEKRFGLEYDLDIFNIVAVSDFNFGAMENKGLNIFNDKLVFAHPDTATDGDYEGIERVIAHEYFHNWTGNRITCRDWFQLCLKEGLTVYRDQEFTSDERSRAVKRIGDVVGLRGAQFAEDGGPLAHPARPDEYREINNFYTATVYEKGAEIVRMLATLLGEAGFRKGMDLYFERHDGEATTIEAFLNVFGEANGTNLDQFKTWYLQAGTPRLTVEDNYDAANQTYTLKLKQETLPTPGQPTKAALVVPIKFGLIGPNGSPMEWSGVSGAEVRDEMIVLNTDAAEVTFTGVANRPVPSLLREFSAPVNMTTNLTQDDQLFLARHDNDPFNRWQALQDVGMALALSATKGTPWSDNAVAALSEAMADTLASDTLDDAFKALSLTIPAEYQIAQNLGSDVDPVRVHEVRSELLKAIFAPLAIQLLQAYRGLASDQPYAPDAKSNGHRALRNRLLGLLVASDAPGAANLAAEQYETARNMTDRLAALGASAYAWTEKAPVLLADFKIRFGGDPLVLDKWLAVTAAVPEDGVIERIRTILADPTFPKTNPNRLRSLMGVFAMSNPTQFTRADGAGFRFVAEFVAEIDKINPQVAARVLTGFRIWPMLEPKRREAAKSVLTTLQSGGSLSRNTADILTRMLAG
ncbi:aminopeptidase N [Devosia epidermidihirudinis]|uniref:Aminopeptidase N n=1 Tax=Devosia epidermidihirudinis TaxID=1293439 RepID=A0A0F5QFR7_9HYPH|nr:aminopeptidase N [Devosia epidermidihirudinis]KKC39795.1 aminopeptidase N [Devosia epidermidihirudinis]